MAARDAARDKTCISELAIEGHGNGEYVRINGDSSKYLENSGAEIIGPGNVLYVGTQLAALPFCCPCVIYLGGCNTGLLRGKSDWLDIIADATGCTVIAPQGYSRGSYLTGKKDTFVWNSTLTGYWGENEPQTKGGDPVDRYPSTFSKHRIVKPRKGLARSCDKGKTRPTPTGIIKKWANYRNRDKDDTDKLPPDYPLPPPELR